MIEVPRLHHPVVRWPLDRTIQAGESPCWDERRQALFFVDMAAPAVLRLDVASGAVESWEMPARIGSLGLCADGRVVVALKSGVHLFDLDSGSLELVADPEGDRPNNRLNDGKVGPNGSFWVGSMSGASPPQAGARLFRIDADGTCTTMADGLMTSNGLAWSPDGRLMYHSDSRGRFLQVFDHHPQTGAIANARRLRDLDEAEGRPDGAAIDVEGYYWSAGVSAGCVNRIAPDGRIIEKYLLPVAAPSMPCFGGPELRTLYVTSLSTDRTGTPETGTVTCFEVDVAGVPVARFGEPLPVE
jgi:sugar lactone lactonase YvrE